MLSSRTSSGTGLRALSIPFALGLLLAMAAPVSADPPGNNGTVKIDGIPLPDNHPNNEPHVDCEFQVDFYGFDSGASAEVIFELQPPTVAGRTMTVDGNQNPSLGGTDNSGGGSEAGLDASVLYTLAFTGDPHPEQQGYHVKLTIHAPGMQGADVKHKVFWVTACEGQLGGNPPPPPPTNGNGGQLAGSPPPRQGTQAGVGGPAARVPNTATSSESGDGLPVVVTGLLALLAASGTYAAAYAVARGRER